MAELPSSCNTLVVGGGIVGASIAYHLTKKGIDDVVLLERHELTGGTTWHAAGLVAQLRSTENQTKLAKYSLDLYKDLEDETGLATGFRSPGAISVATTQDRWIELRRNAAMARYLNVDAKEVSPDEIKEMWPLCNTDDLVGGIWLPEDSTVGPSDVTLSLARGARNGGAKIHQGVAVEDLLVENGRCVGVRTEDGSEITAENVVLACGMWTRHLAAKAGVSVPLQSAEHYYIVTEPMDGIDAEAPVLRDPDGYAYLKPEAGGAMLVGMFEPICRPWPADVSRPPTNKPYISLDPDNDHLLHYLEPSFARIPALQTAGIRLLFNGPESFTPDDNYILGEAPNLDRLFIAAGFNSIGIQSAGGAGMALAHWIVEGEPPFDIHDVDIRRFERFQSSDPYLKARTVETLGLLYADHYPHKNYDTARGIRRSPLHQRLEEAGASFVEVTGWERPGFFARPELGIEAEWNGSAPGPGLKDRDHPDKSKFRSWGREHWHQANAIEHAAVRETVGLFDLTSFAKFNVQGADAGAVLDYLSSGSVNGDVGASTYTQWCNDHGGIEADLTISKVGPEEFWVIGGAGTRMRDLTTLRRACDGKNASVVDITSAYACCAVMGPNARDLLSTLTTTDLSDEAFPFGTNQEIRVGSAVVMANRMSYVGELGWELYVPSDFAVHLWDQIVSAGTGADGGPGFGLELAGYMTLNSLRFEKGYRHWGHDITPDDTPIEAGLSFAIAWDKESDFRGRAALEAQRATGATQRLVQVKLVQEDNEAAEYLHHNEPLYRNGERVGYITGGMWGHTVGAAIGMGLAIRGEKVDGPWINDAEWAVELPSGMVPALVQLRPFL